MNDLRGQRFGLLRVIDLAKRPDGSRAGLWWRCRCDCGSRRDVAAEYLKQGKISSCGCLKKANRHKLINKIGSLHDRIAKLQSKQTI